MSTPNTPTMDRNTWLERCARRLVGQGMIPEMEARMLAQNCLEVRGPSVSPETAADEEIASWEE